MLSLGLGWVKVIPGFGTEGHEGVAFGIILSLIPLSSMAADCFDMAGRDYKIDRISCVLYHGKNHDLKLMRLGVILLRVMDQA